VKLEAVSMSGIHIFYVCPVNEGEVHLDEFFDWVIKEGSKHPGLRVYDESSEVVSC
jgi:hypothetical protein